MLDWWECIFIFLRPQTALLKGQAEGVIQLGREAVGASFSNVGDFDGRANLRAEELGGHGEFFARVGTESRI
ncbi:hypothetical protein [Bradyrhizobium sp. CB3481]|uniref:hypothetical protein n=1 Tax=Bradyrhizobium sp. CB3481 TaxID=3039158 RepID=UPI0024B1B0F6|nr:hypothetical protein [Bradyrhizobium sp. CB3481]WFU14922.1 hypothetical protein QA643_28600 [Bradyrhizobium sp. CB3481]